MIPAKKTIPILVLTITVLLTAAAASAASRHGRWSGTVAAIQGDDLALVGIAERFRLAGSVTELVSGRALSPRDIAPGSAVTLRIGVREADGRFRVDALTVQPKNPLVLEGPITSVDADGRALSVLGVRISLDQRTGFSGNGRAGVARSARDLEAGMTAQVRLDVTGSGKLATHVRVMSSHGRSSSRVVSGRRELGEDQEVRGTVGAVSDSSWTIDGRAFAVGPQTVFLGDPGVGDFVEVRFHLDAGGNAVADRIQKEDAADDELEFRGIVEAIGAASWTVSGRVVQVNGSTVIRGNPQIGDLVEVRADRAPDGTLTATDIHGEDDANADDEREFRGAVEAIGAASWTIGGRVVLVTAATVIEGDPKVGDQVEVRADRAPDGTLTATRIHAEDGDDDGGGGGNGDDDPPGDDGGGNGNDDPPGDDGGHGGGGNSGPGGR